MGNDARCVIGILGGIKNLGSTKTEELEEIKFVQVARYIMQTCKVMSVINSDNSNTISVLSNLYCILFTCILLWCMSYTPLTCT